jgi:hypothetical protein
MIRLILSVSKNKLIHYPGGQRDGYQAVNKKPICTRYNNLRNGSDNFCIDNNHIFNCR